MKTLSYTTAGYKILLGKILLIEKIRIKLSGIDI